MASISFPSAFENSILLSLARLQSIPIASEASTASAHIVAISSHLTVATIIACAGKSKSRFSLTAFQISLMDVGNAVEGTLLSSNFVFVAEESNAARSPLHSFTNNSFSCSKCGKLKYPTSKNSQTSDCAKMSGFLIDCHTW